MAVNVITEFGANTKKFDKAVEKSSEKAKKRMEDIGKGARVAGGKVGELTEKFNNLATAGKLGMIAAGLGLILSLSRKIRDMSEKMFEKAVEDTERMTNDFRSMSAIRSGQHNENEKALDILRSVAGKENLTKAEQVEARRAISLLQKQGAISSGLTLQNGKLQGFNDISDAEIERRLIKARRTEIDGEIMALQQQIQAYNKEYERLMAWRWSRISEDPFNWIENYFETDPEKAEDYMHKKLEAQNQIARLLAERKKLEEQNELAGVRSQARFGDIDDERRKKAEEEARKKQLKELTEKRSGISFLSGASQMFTNSLTSRGGWAGGGKIWDTGNYQQQMLQYNAQQQATLQDIDKKIEELQRI